jgi:hypothetical protein
MFGQKSVKVWRSMASPKGSTPESGKRICQSEK